MNPEVKKITDRSRHEDLLGNVFATRQVFVRSGEVNAAVDFFSYSSGVITFRTGHSIGGPSVILYVRRDSEILLARAAVEEARGNEYRCRSTEMLSMHMPRKEERYHVEPRDKAPEGVYVSNILSDFTLKESLAFNRRKLGMMKTDLENRLSKNYGRSRIFFIHEHKHDPRMEFFIRERVPLFIRNVNDPGEETGNPHAKAYKNSIYNNDPGLDASWISEIAVPFLYKSMLPFGYLQVNAKDPLSDEDGASLKKIGISVSNAFSSDERILKCSDDRIAVVDVSMSGIGMIFRERTFIKHFKENSLLQCTVFLPGGKLAAILGLTKNITILKSGIYRIGCSIITIDPIGEVNYSEYIDSMKAAESGEDPAGQG